MFTPEEKIMWNTFYFSTFKFTVFNNVTFG